MTLLALAAVAALNFENPVIRTNWPDPTFWQDGAGTCYGVASDLAEIRTSADLIHWDPIGPVMDASSKSNLVEFSNQFWAPDAVKIGNEFRIYVTQFVTSDTNRLVCLSSENPRGPFRFRSVVLDNRDFGIRDLAIDSEVVVDDGKVWLFTGSVAGGVHRFEMTGDGLALKTRTPVHVAGLLPGGHDRKWIYSHPCYEGAYLYRRDGWWYLFVSAGAIAWDEYHLCCGRSRTLDGDFVDAKGVSLAKGGGETLLVSNAEFPGPGHNGEIFTDRVGRDYMFFHSHWSAFPQDFIEFQRRCLNLQRIYWNADGWPYFETGSVKSSEVVPQMGTVQNAWVAKEPDMIRKESNVGTLPKFNPAAWEYLRGWFPPDAKGDNGPTADSVDPASVRVFTLDGRELVRDVDFAVDPVWGSVGVIGKLAEGPMAKYRIDYSYALQRLDSRVRRTDGTEVVRHGNPVKCAPRLPELAAGERRLANVHVKRSTTNEYPVLEGADQAPRTKAAAAMRIPKTLAKLERGEPVTILAWGDSVTAGLFLREEEKWQVQFVDWLRLRYPKSSITLNVCAWPGRTSCSFLAQKPGSEFCYAEKVAGAKADLVISEFINDAGLTLADWERTYNRVLADFKASGKEWVILTPHYAWHPLMQFPTEDESDDTRPFVKFLRAFAARNGIGLADASLRWGHLKKEGIPYETLLVNGINHPTPQGMTFFVDALKDFFGAAERKPSAPAYASFAEPPADVRPWVYYWWMNGHADEETIERDIALMADLGFGGILFSDIRNYWDDDDHLVLPKPENDFMGERWNDLVATMIRACAKHGLVFSMNASSSGGTLAGYRGKELYEVDISDRQQVKEHLDRLFNPIFARVGDLVGTTFREVYSVSWEGKTPKGEDPHALNRKILTNFYGTMRDWAHAHGLAMSSESGGPWRREQGDFVGADQLEFLGVNDVPQGEFWLKTELVFLCSPVANAARVYGRRIASAEAFTHMEHHWSVVPEDLKRQGDRAFVDGINRLVWHGFTSSPKRFGVPGLEYFAGTHINGNVTWCREAAPFVKYLGRCQAILQRGEAVVDLGVLAGTDPYRHWGHYRDEPWAGAGIKLPRGYQYDVLTSQTPAAAKARYACLIDTTKTPVQFPKLPLPDCLLPSAWDFAHRRDGGTDYYFVVGEGWGEGIFRTKAANAEIWDPVTGRRYAAPFKRLGDGRAFLTFELPRNGSFFVVFGEAADGKDLPVSPYLKSGCAERLPVAGPWDVSFAYPDGIRAEPPKARALTSLVNWGQSEEDALRSFSGTGTYRTKVVLDARQAAFGRVELALGSVGVGVAHVFVNGKDCGTVWASPWKADVTGAVRAGENDLEILVINTWANRLAADARLEPTQQTAETNVKRRPTHGMNRCAGYDLDFRPQDAGLLGPVSLELSNP